MQALFVSFAGGSVVKVDVLHTVGGVDLSATAQSLMEEYWSSGHLRVDVCRIYLVHNACLVLGGEEYGSKNVLKQVHFKEGVK